MTAYFDGVGCGVLGVCVVDSEVVECVVNYLLTYHFVVDIAFVGVAAAVAAMCSMWVVVVVGC